MISNAIDDHFSGRTRCRDEARRYGDQLVGVFSEIIDEAVEAWIEEVLE